MKRWIPLVALLPLFCMSSCVSQFSNVARGGQSKTDEVISELRLEIAELKHYQKAQQVDLEILEEKLGGSASSSSLAKEVNPLLDKMHQLESSVTQLKKSQDHFLKDLKNLHEAASKNGQLLNEHRHMLGALQEAFNAQSSKINDLKDLKNTLSSIKEVMNEATSAFKNYKVKSGDSLEKIARLHKISVERLRECNQLSSDHIKIGQNLKIPTDG